MENFEAFHKDISTSMNFIFLKSEQTFFIGHRDRKSTITTWHIFPKHKIRQKYADSLSNDLMITLQKCLKKIDHKIYYPYLHIFSACLTVMKKNNISTLVIKVLLLLEKKLIFTQYFKHLSFSSSKQYWFFSQQTRDVGLNGKLQTFTQLAKKKIAKYSANCYC